MESNHRTNDGSTARTWVSQRCVEWALDEAPVPASLVAALVVIARIAHNDGTASYQSIPTIAAKLRKSARQAQREIRALLKLGLIREGNQALVEHLSAGSRPIVYDLCLDRVEG